MRPVSCRAAVVEQLIERMRVAAEIAYFDVNYTAAEFVSATLTLAMRAGLATVRLNPPMRDEVRRGAQALLAAVSAVGPETFN